MGEHFFHTPEPVKLRIAVPVGDVVVETIDGDESSIVVEGSERLVDATVVEQRGRQLLVELKGKKPFGFVIGIGDFSFGSGSLRVRARVPQASTASLATASADAKLRGRYAELETKSASGDLVLNGEVEGDASVKTVSGDVRLDRVGGELRVQTVSGDVQVDQAEATIEMKTVSGDVRIDRARAGSATFTSVSGDIEVGVAPGTNLDVDAGSVSGDLESEVPLGSDPGAGVGDGPVLVVRGKTVSGDFRVFRAA